MLTSQTIRDRIARIGEPCNANDNISEYITASELAALEDELACNFKSVLNTLIIDTESDHNTRATSKRMAKMFLRELFIGRYIKAPKITDFPNVKNLDQIYTIGPVTINSTCSHHFVPISGSAWLGIIPDGRVIGLSKFKRLCDWIFLRPQIQEEATVMLADELEKRISPRALGLIVKAKHQCVICRGVKDGQTNMITSIMRGIFFDNPIARQEFMTLIKEDF